MRLTAFILLFPLVFVLGFLAFVSVGLNAGCGSNDPGVCFAAGTISMFMMPLAIITTPASIALFIVHGVKENKRARIEFTKSARIQASIPAIPKEVAEVYDSFPNDIQELMMAIRSYIFEEALLNPSVGTISETLKWNQPAYLTDETKSGETIRLTWNERKPNQFAMLVNYQTSLIASFKEYYDSVLTFDGTRAIVFERGKPLPEDATRHCIAMAQTYNLNN